jgi:3-methyladenine DNA glycosylase/8-oxoguanine DNA glycosylase
MASRFTIKVPDDYVLARDACSYGYFLLAPAHWDPQTQTYWRVLSINDRPVIVRIDQSRLRKQAVARPSNSPDHRAQWRPGAPLQITTDRTLSRPERIEAEHQISRMLRLDESAATIADFHARDPRFSHTSGTLQAGRGRLMRSPTFFEDVIKTVTSCNVAWTSTIIMNARLCAVVGVGGPGSIKSPHPCGGKAFPTPRRVAAKGPGILRARCSVGYRDQRIVELARMFERAGGGSRTGKSGGAGASRKSRLAGIDTAWFEDPATPDDAVHEALIALPGIGPYAAANIMQLLGRYSRLPLDSESLRHAKSVLGWEGTDRALMKRLHDHYAPMGPDAFRSYWFELWTFYETRRGPSWTWQRETTGKTFTAALLK